MLRPTRSWQGVKPHLAPKTFFLLLSNKLSFCSCGAPSLTRGRVCRLQLLLNFVSALTLDSESRGTHEQKLLSQVQEAPNLEGQVPEFISSRKNVAQLYLRHWVPFSSPPMTPRATVEVFEPTSKRAAPTTYPQSRSLATAVVLLPVYTAVTWQWLYMSQYCLNSVTWETYSTYLRKAPCFPFRFVNQWAVRTIVFNLLIPHTIVRVSPTETTRYFPVCFRTQVFS
jgi:hypothetical protein